MPPHTDFTVADDIAQIAPIIVGLANRCAEYEASGSTAWDSAMGVRQRPDWLKRVETKVYTQLSQSKGNDDGADNGEASVNDNLTTSIAVDATIELSVDVLDDAQQPGAQPNAQQRIDQIDLLKLRQQEQMSALLVQQTQVNVILCCHFF